MKLLEIIRNSSVDFNNIVEDVMLRLKEKQEKPDETHSELLAHPLFLQMTLDLFFQGHEELMNSEEKLIDTWVRAKIERDLESPRLHGFGSLDVDDYVDGMCSSMREIALKMASADTDKSAVDEYSLDEVLESARRHTTVYGLDSSTLLLTSLYVPVTKPRGERKVVRFFHRRIQDHFILVKDRVNSV